MNVLVLNTGSSSLKFQVVDTDLDVIEKNADRQLARGVLERIGSESLVTLRVEGRPRCAARRRCATTAQALDYVLRWLVSAEAGVPGISALGDVHAVGHRVVHGGEKFTRSTLITDEVIDQIEDCIDLAPLHNPANLKGIYAAARAARPRRAAGGRVRHLVPPDDARGGVPVRDPLPALRAAQDPPLRLPRHLAPLRGLPLPGAHGQARARTRTSSRCTSATAARRARSARATSVDTSMGLTPARGPGDGHALGRHRPVGARVPAPQGGACRSRRSTRCSTSSPGCSGSRGSPTTCASCSRRSACTRTAARGSRSRSSSTASGTTWAPTWRR